MITDENCKSAIETKMAEVVDLLAQFPRAEIDERAWRQLLIYAPKEDELSGVSLQ